MLKLLNFEIISLIASWIVFIITLALAIIKSLAHKRESKSDIKISEIIREVMESAETFTEWSGATKKAWALATIKSALIDNHIHADAEHIENELEKNIAFSKKINYNKEE